VTPDRCQVPVSARLDAQALNRLKSKGGGYLTRINDILTNLDGGGSGHPAGSPAS
jgi:uncharacterized protein (DUF4415 family)